MQYFRLIDRHATLFAQELNAQIIFTPMTKQGNMEKL